MAAVVRSGQCSGRTMAGEFGIALRVNFTDVAGWRGWDLFVRSDCIAPGCDVSMNVACGACYSFSGQQDI